ncbi:hypothetical protein QF026_002845 [Streptomyces aurantiacus]|uniref:DUF6059 family protein n=1 Tax=Streptomyces aurantiacus TaxID=47760 RepID=UPI00278F1229|nr:DUF6059 family protein [Streptomyces aurantiacus]MDQ0774379.1 hypothetical protein [Streptomyces aurantiacus]
MKYFVRRCARVAWQSLVAYGATQATPPLCASPLLFSPPPANGPERLVPDRPLTEFERSLDRELTRHGGFGA